MSRQRRRGQTARIWPTRVTTDNRGQKVKVPDLEAEPFVVTGVFIPQRSAKAEVPGQAQINIVRMLVTEALAGVDIWSRVEYQGKQWDIVSPPAYHHGSRQVRHWSIDIRERP